MQELAGGLGAPLDLRLRASGADARGSRDERLKVAERELDDRIRALGRAPEYRRPITPRANLEDLVAYAQLTDAPRLQLLLAANERRQQPARSNRVLRAGRPAVDLAPIAQGRRPAPAR